MPRAVATAIENNFLKGLITETTALQAPENSVAETQNCVFGPLGEVTRRPGFDYEYGYDTATINKNGAAINMYQWKNVTGDGQVSFLVVQIGTFLHFYSSTDGSTSLSSQLLVQTIDLVPFQASGSPAVYQYECQFADGLAKLYVVHPCCQNFYVTYDPTTQAFSAKGYDLEIRDFEGVPDGLDLTTRPLTLSDEHEYNLFNQGWDIPKLNVWNTAESNYPSNSDVWYLYNDIDDVFNPEDTFDNVSNTGNGQAAQGHYILSVYNGGRDQSTLEGLPETTSGSARSSAVAFFAGRAWYSGIQAAGFNSKVYFSQIIVKDDQAGKCYQQCDPTDSQLFDLLPADGGVIAIPEAGTIYKLFPMQNNLLVFGYRGVWLISGSTGLGFRATDFVVSKLGSTRTVSATSFVEVNGLPVWWNTDGIWGVQPNQNGGFQIVRMTLNTIQTFYDDIPAASKTTARGYYNPLDQVVTWIYRSEAPGTIEEQYEFDRCLCFSGATGAFYPWEVSEGVTLHGITAIDGSGGTVEESFIIDEASDQVVDDAGDIVTGFAITNIAVSTRTKFLCSVPNGSNADFTFAEANDFSYTDWVAAGFNQPYNSYLITGYKLHTQANKNFQSNYVTIYNTGIGSFSVQGLWDFALTGNTGRHTSRQVCNFNDFDYDTGFRRLKMRGQGKSLQYKIASLPGQGFNLIGWSAWETSNSTP